MPPNSTIPNNAEIDQALKEFEAKQSVEKIQKAPEASKTSEIPKMVKMVMKWSGFKEQKQAECALFGFVVVAIIISLFLFFKGSGESKKVLPITPEQKSFMETGHGL